MKAKVTITKKADDSFIDALSVRWADGWEMKCCGLRMESREPVEFETEWVHAQMHGSRSRFTFLATGGTEITFLAIDAPIFTPASDLPHDEWNAIYSPGCS